MLRLTIYKKINNLKPQVVAAHGISAQYGVSPATVKRAEQYADAVDKVTKAIPDANISAQPRQAVVKAAAILEKSPDRAAEIILGARSMADVKREEHREDNKMSYRR